MNAAAKTSTRSLVVALLAAGLLSLALASAASASVTWRVSSHHGPTNLAPGDADESTAEGQYVIQAHNTGTTDADNVFAVTEELPPGVTATGWKAEIGWDCDSLTDFSSHPSMVTCLGFVGFAAAVGVPSPYRDAAPALFIDVSVAPGASGTHDAKTTIAGGETATCPDFPPTPTPPCPSATDVDPTTISSTPAGFGLEDFVADFFDGAGTEAGPEHQAGSHPPESRFDFDFNLKRETDPVLGSYTTPEERVRTIETRLPAGFVGNPEAAAKCTAAQLSTPSPVNGFIGSCPMASQVGSIDLTLNDGPEIKKLAVYNWPTFTQDLPVYNMVPEKGVLADFAFVFQQFPTHITISLDPSDNYRVLATVNGVTELYPVRTSELSLWGVPADPSHDALRFDPQTGIYGNPAGLPPRPFATMPSDCSAASGIEMRLASWQHPSVFKEYAAAPFAATGCAKQSFKPKIDIRPTAKSASSPSGLSVDLEVPQDETPDGVATPPLRRSVVTLPEGLTLSASAANGLGACSPAQIGLGTDDPVACPGSAKVGSLSVKTATLEDPIAGDVYLAEPYENPFKSLLAIYVVLAAPERGILVKVPGELRANPKTGRLEVEFSDLPPLPFSDLHLELNSGPRAPLHTPDACGAYSTAISLASWNGALAPSEMHSTFQVEGGPDGGPCPPTPRPFHPGFSAGSLNNNAGSFSPFLMRATRRDGEQELTKFSATLPPGVLGKLAGVGKCPDAAIAAAKAKAGREEQANPSCPASSQIGESTVGAGTGSILTYVPGKIYLGGPYKGDPLSVIAITPAVAGPYDIGTVVVQEALDLNPRTAEVEVDGANSDPIPHILKGIPVALRDLRVDVDRESFTLNPTSCDPSSARATMFGSYLDLLSPADDVGVDLSTRYQAAGCAALGYKPKLALRLSGGTRRGAHPALTATYRPRPGDANSKGIVVRLPRSAFLDQGHIRTICTRVQFAAKACPKAAQYGYIRAWTPLIDEPLEGPVWLRSSNHKLPDLVFDLHGLVDVEVATRIDSIGGGIRATVDAVPDAPLSKVVLKMQGARKGLIVNSRDLCGGANRANAQFTGQNGKLSDFNPALRADCGGKS